MSDEWIKCSERLPDVNGHYLVFSPTRTMDKYSVQAWDNRENSFSNLGKLVTNWQHLPSPPKESDDDK